MSTPEPFDQFLAHTAVARPEDYESALRNAAVKWGLARETAVAEFERMKAHILRYYEDVHPVRSFLDPAGQPVDCVPFEQQPTVRATQAVGHPVLQTSPRPTPPASDATPPTEAPESTTSRAEAPKRPPLCPPGTIPLLRLTLERMISLGTFDNFFRKTPVRSAASAPPS